MIYLTENGAYFEEDYKAMVESKCEAHVGTYNLWLKLLSEAYYEDGWRTSNRKNAEANAIWY